MAVTPRIGRTNLVQQSTASLTASSFQAGFDVQLLLDQARGRRWRSALGWTVVAGFNDALLWSSTDGVRIGYVAPGTYATPAAYATAVQNAYNASGLNPISIPATAWFRSDSVTLDANNLVQTAVDISGNGRNLTQGSASLRPTWVASAVNGRPGIYWNNSAQNMALSSSVAASNFLGTNGKGYVITVYMLDSDMTGTGYFWCVASGTNSWADGNWNVGAAAAISTIRNTTPATFTASKASGGLSAVQHHEWGYDQVNIQSYSGNVDTASVANTASTLAINASGLTANFNMGGGLSGVSHLDAIKGYIFEQIVLAAVPTENIRRGLEQYLKARYPSLVDASTIATWTAPISIDPQTFRANTYSIVKSAGAGNISILANTGTPTIDKGSSAHPDLGLVTSSDKTGLTSYFCDTVSYQSQHFLKVDLGSALATRLGSIIDDNGSATKVFTQQANAIDLWVSPTVSNAVGVDSGDGTMTYAYWNSTSQRWWRLVINDVQNPAGYAEVGVWQLMDYVQPSQQYDGNFIPDYEDLSQRSYGTFGAIRLDERPQRGIWQLIWTPLTTTDYNIFVTLRKTPTPIGRCFFFAFDSTGDPTNVKYVELVKELHTPHLNKTNDLWRVDMSIREALP